MRRHLPAAGSSLLLLALLLANGDTLSGWVSDWRHFPGRSWEERERAALRERTVWGELPNPRHPERSRMTAYQGLAELADAARAAGAPALDVAVPPALADDGPTRNHLLGKLQLWLYPCRVRLLDAAGAGPAPARFLLVVPGAAAPAGWEVVHTTPHGGALYRRAVP